MSNIDYTDVVTGPFRALRLWKDFDRGEWVIDAERLDGSLSTQEWGYTRLERALADVPLLHAVLVIGVQITSLDDGQWQVSIPITPPIEGSEYHEVSQWPSKEEAERFMKGWVQ